MKPQQQHENEFMYENRCSEIDGIRVIIETIRYSKLHVSTELFNRHIIIIINVTPHDFGE